MVIELAAAIQVFAMWRLFGTVFATGKFRSEYFTRYKEESVSETLPFEKIPITCLRCTNTQRKRGKSEREGGRGESGERKRDRGRECVHTPAPTDPHIYYAVT